MTDVSVTPTSLMGPPRFLLKTPARNPFFAFPNGHSLVRSEHWLVVMKFRKRWVLQIEIGFLEQDFSKPLRCQCTCDSKRGMLLLLLLLFFETGPYCVVQADLELTT